MCAIGSDYRYRRTTLSLNHPGVFRRPESQKVFRILLDVEVEHHLSILLGDLEASLPLVVFVGFVVEVEEVLEVALRRARAFVLMT